MSPAPPAVPPAQLRKLKNLVKLSRGSVSLARLASILQLDGEDALVTFLAEAGLDGLTIDWEADAVVFADGAGLADEIDALIAGYDGWGKERGGKVDTAPHVPPDLPTPAKQSYHGTPLVAVEADVMAALERQVGEPIPVVGEVEWNTFGFVPDADGHVAALGLYKKGLTSLPETFGQLSALQELYLYKNQFTSLPETFGDLSALQHLDLMWNQLSSLPETFGNLQSLQWLRLRENQLTSLPETFGQLSSLQHLELQYNSLSSLPETIGQLTSLQTLYLSGNKLASLPETFGNLQSLQWLRLRENQLTPLPETLERLGALETLYLDEALKRDKVAKRLRKRGVTVDLE